MNDDCHKHHKPQWLEPRTEGSEVPATTQQNTFLAINHRRLSTPSNSRSPRQQANRHSAPTTVARALRTTQPRCSRLCICDIASYLHATTTTTTTTTFTQRLHTTPHRTATQRTAIVTPGPTPGPFPNPPSSSCLGDCELHGCLPHLLHKLSWLLLPGCARRLDVLQQQVQQRSINLVGLLCCWSSSSSSKYG